MTRAFIDSNVAIYGYSNDVRAARAKYLLTTSPVISVQTLNEFTNVARRKLGLAWDQIERVIEDLLVLCPVIVELTVDLHVSARAIAERYQLQFYDALVVAAALHAECDLLFSEDMHDGLVIEQRLTIRNPFADVSQ